MHAPAQIANGPYWGTLYGQEHAQQIILLPALGFGPEIWGDCAAILAKHHAVSCLELPALNQFTAGTDQTVLQIYSQWLVELLQQDKFRTATVVGIDFTAQLALRVLAEQPQRINKVVAFAPTGLAHAIDPMVRLLRNPVAGQLILATAAGARLNRLITPHVYNKQRLPVGFLKKFFREIKRKNRRQAILDIIRHVALHEDDQTILKQAANVKDKIMLVWGEHDRKLHFTYGQRFASAINLPLHKINYAGHLVPLEQPRWAASLIEHAIDPHYPVHVDLRGYNGVACADYIVRSEIAAKPLKSNAELIIHTLYQCAGEDAKTWDRLTNKFGLVGIRYLDDEWQIQVKKK